MHGRITQSEIARRAGVHVSTVSLALRNHPSLPAATREKLQALALEMGYRPDPSLSALIAYRRKAQPRPLQAPLAYLTSWDTMWGWKQAPAHVQFFAGASARAGEVGYPLEHFWLGEPGLSGRRMSEILTARGITGLVVASHQRDNAKLLDFDWSRFSAVKIDFLPHQPELHTVTNDQRAIIRLAMRRVRAAGYRRIGLVMPRSWDDFVDRAWSCGYLGEQQDFAASEQIPILFYVEEAPAGGGGEGPGDAVPVRVFKSWFERYRPEVLISYRPLLLPTLSALGLAVPRDVAYVDIFLNPPDGATAGVRENCFRVGELAVEILAGQLEQHTFGVPELPTATYVEGTWFDGASLPLRTKRVPVG